MCNCIHLLLLLVSSAFFFLLCLLKAVVVLADTGYTWGGPGSGTDTVDPNTENGEEFDMVTVSSMCSA